MPGSTAEKMGLQVGDRITLMNGLVANGANDLQLMQFALRIAKLDAGTTVRLTVKRDGETLQMHGELGGVEFE